MGRPWREELAPTISAVLNSGSELAAMQQVFVRSELQETQSSDKRSSNEYRISRPTYHAFSRERPPRASGRVAWRLPPINEDATCSRCDATLD